MFKMVQTCATKIKNVLVQSNLIQIEGSPSTTGRPKLFGSRELEMTC